MDKVGLLLLMSIDKHDIDIISCLLDGFVFWISVSVLKGMYYRTQGTHPIQ